MVSFQLRSIFVCLGLLAAAPSFAETGDQIAKRFMEKAKVPGLVFLVLHHGGIVARGAYGVSDVASKEPVTLMSVFPIASLSKPFLAMAVLSLVEKGQIRLTDSIGSYLPDLPEDWRPITVIRLLDHTSGVPDHFNSGKYPVYSMEPVPSDELIKKLTALPLHFKPGEKFEYSNGNYVLLAKMLEKVTGVPYGRYLEEKIFGPLGMKDTKVMMAADLAKAVHGYLPTQRGLVERSFNPDWCFGNGALGSTVMDLARLDAALYTQRLLKKSTLQFVTTPQPLNDGKFAPYAMGWAIGSLRGAKVVQHSGRVGGWQSYFARFADLNLTVIVLSNNYEANLSTVAVDLAGTVEPMLNLSPIKDDYPDLTARHRAFVESIEKGTVDVNLLSPVMKADYTAKNQWSSLREMLQKASKEGSFAPVAREKQGDGRLMSKYRLERGSSVWAVTFWWDDTGTITGMMFVGG